MITDLSPGKPIHEQLDVLTSACKGYVCLQPAFSALAEKAFQMKESKRVEPVGPKGIQLDPGNTTVPEMHGWTMPFITPWIDPRKEPFRGDPERAAAYIGCLLALVVEQEMANNKLMGKPHRIKRRSTVMVAGKVPPGGRKPDEKGLSLSTEVPLLRGRVDLIMEEGG